MVVSIFDSCSDAQLCVVLDSIVERKESALLQSLVTLLQYVVDVFHVVFIQAVVIIKVGCQAEISRLCAFFLEQFAHYLLEDVGEVPSLLILYRNEGNLRTKFAITRHSLSVLVWCRAADEKNPCKILTCLANNGRKRVCFEQLEAFLKPQSLVNVMTLLVIAEQADVETCQDKVMEHTLSVRGTAICGTKLRFLSENEKREAKNLQAKTIRKHLCLFFACKICKIVRLLVEVMLMPERKTVYLYIYSGILSLVKFKEF